MKTPFNFFRIANNYVYDTDKYKNEDINEISEDDLLSIINNIENDGLYMKYQNLPDYFNLINKLKILLRKKNLQKINNIK